MLPGAGARRQRRVGSGAGAQRSQPVHVRLHFLLKDDSAESGVELEHSAASLCTYVCVSSKRPLQLTLTPAAARGAHALLAAAASRGPRADAHLHPCLVNHIGPGSTVFLRTSAETDLAGNDRVIAVADYDTDNSRPSTPGGDTSGADLLDDVKEKKSEVTDVAEDWDCVFEGGFGAAEMSASPGAPGAAGPAAPGPLLRRLTALTLSIRLHDFDPLTIVGPPPTTRSESWCALHCRYAMRHRTHWKCLRGARNRRRRRGICAMAGGCTCQPVRRQGRLAVIEPHAVCNLPLHVAYHCRLYLAPSNFESFRTQTTEAIWWKELANDVGSPRDLLCPASDGDDNRAFALRIIPVLGRSLYWDVGTMGAIAQSEPRHPELHAARGGARWPCATGLPLALELSCPARGWAVRAEAGEAPRAHHAPPPPLRRLPLLLRVRCPALLWHAAFSLCPDVTEKNINLTTECDKDSGDGRRLLVSLKVERHDSWQLLFHAQYWFINKTGLPLQIRGQHSEECYEVTDEPLLWRPGRRRGRRGAARVHVRAHSLRWSRGAPLVAAAPSAAGRAAHAERRTLYRLLLTGTCCVTVVAHTPTWSPRQHCRNQCGRISASQRLLAARARRAGHVCTSLLLTVRVCT
ncbi:hypothetical protein ACJJTC_018566 [Scirpophaga incertulas]